MGEVGAGEPAAGRADLGGRVSFSLLLAALTIVRGATDELRIWLIVEGLVLAVIVAGVWFVAKRRRRIAAGRGLNCSSRWSSAEKATSFSSRFSRVSSFLALMIHQVAAFR